MNAEQLQRLWREAERLHTFLNRDLTCGWALPGTNMQKLQRITDRAWQRSERRRLALMRRLGAIRENRGA